MCLAIYKPKDKTVPLEHLKIGFSNHDDGAGIAWAKDGILYMKKGMFKVEELIEQYELVKEYDCLIHFRRATHGDVDSSNCHPFLFNDGKLALIHNGILPIQCNIEGLSDTAHFVKLVLEPLIKKYNIPINDGALGYLISTSIGTDKVAVMNGNGETFIFNEDKGTWEGGVWYSNTSFRWLYKTPTTTPATPTTSLGNKSSHNNNFSHSSSRNWRKHWEEPVEDDRTYLAFWKKATKEHVVVNSDNQPKLLKENVDSAGNVTIIDVEVEQTDETRETGETRTQGTMCEYGYYDEEVESEIAKFIKTIGLSREEAIIRVFNDFAR